ncbi:methyltransferase [Bradyrhizobium sp. SYSU BS000235]|uniref:methyltransferase n=1 Tax=Bradyrhizobium sp. SYSU BS000235 TaxID=3411332 RepID=UPI003C7577F1
MAEPKGDVTDDLFLGGRLRLLQPKRGHRAGHDAILLAAATAARGGDRVVDFGAGVGAAGLAVATRVPGINLVLVEINEALAALAQANADANQLQAQVIVQDVTAKAAVLAAESLGADSVDVVLMNPPFNDAARHRASPDAGRQVAHMATPETLQEWVHTARRVLKPGGTLTAIWRADGLAGVIEALDRGFGSLEIQPVHPAAEAGAIRILVKAVKGGRAPLVLHRGLVLRSETGADAGVQAILDGREVLPLAKPSKGP